MKNSNCLVEAIKQKIRNPKTRIFIGVRKNNVLFVHCWWNVDGKTFHFSVNRNLKFLERFWFAGSIQNVNEKVSLFYHYVAF
jgi:hypothetical protein